MASANEFLGLDISELEAPEKNHRLPRRTKAVVLSDLGTIISWIIDGELKPYRFNRGNGRAGRATANSARQGVDSDCIGECTFGQYNGEICLNNWHSRLYGFLQRMLDGNMTKQELKTPVSCRVQQDHLRGYRGLNPSSSGHLTKDKIKCPDLTYGVIWQKVLEWLEEDCVKRIGDSRWTVFSSIIYSINEIGVKSPGWWWPYIYQKRMASRLIANEDAGTLKIRKSELENFIDSIQFWDDVMQNLDSESGVTNVKKLTKSAGLFGYIISHRMNPNSFMSKSAKVIAKKILRNLEKVQMIAPELCRGNHEAVIKYCIMLDNLLKGRQSKKKTA